MKNSNDNKLERARKKVADIKGFYTHLTIYLIMNTLLVMLHFGVFTNPSLSFKVINANWFGAFSTPFFWGIGLFFHWFKVFKYRYTFFKSWEERKIKEFMERDQQDLDNISRYE